MELSHQNTGDQPVDNHSTGSDRNKVIPDLEKAHGESSITQGQLEDLQKVVEGKITEYEAANKQMVGEFQGEKMPFMELIRRQSTPCDRFIFYLGLFNSIFYGATMPAFCLVFAELIDSVGESVNEKVKVQSLGTDQLTDQALTMMYVALGAWLVTFLQFVGMSMFSERLAFRTKVLYFQSLIEKDSAWYDQHNPNEMASKISKETGAIQRATSDKAGQVITSISAFVLGFAAAFYLGWELTLWLLLAIPFLGIAIAGFISLMSSSVMEIMKAYAQSAGHAEQALQAIKVVQTYGNELVEKQNYEKYLDKSKDSQQSEIKKSAFARSMMFFVIYLFYSHSLYFGGRLRWTYGEQELNGDDIGSSGGTYTGGAVLAIVFLIIMSAFSLAGVGSHAKSMAEGQIAGQLAYDIIDHVPIIDPNKRNQKSVNPSIFPGQIEFKNVGFTYPSRPDLKVLKNFSCVFEAGKTTALVGPSGSGKSTIVQLIERFYDSNEGQILMDGNNNRDLDLRELRQMIGYVGQEPVLFNTTIKENMLFAKPDATDQEITRALEAANAWDFIKTKMGEEGINTQVGGVGGKLSGGQKQRIAIARAFLKKPRILLLDEATSALDRVNEKAIQDAIDRYRETFGDITMIVIAHRLSTIKDAHKIVVMKNGEIVETGTHDRLMAEHPDGVYAGFVAKQEKAEQGTAVKDPLEADLEGAEMPAIGMKTKSVTKSVTVDGEQKEIQVEVSEEEAAQMIAADAADKQYQEELDNLKKARDEVSNFKKVLPYNRPRIYILVAVISSLVNGAVMPCFGIIISRLLGALSMPVTFWELYYKEDESLEKDIILHVKYILLIAVCALIFGYFQKFSFGKLGANITDKLRKLLYSKILEKNLGWFDERENSTSILTSAMAHDPSLVNGASTESLGPTMEANCAMLVGIGIGFYFCWQEALCCLLVSPLLIVGQIIKMNLMHKQAASTNDSMKEADLMCGDSISNYKTVQSFGHDNMFVEKYRSLIEPITKANIVSHFQNGLAFGLSQFLTYVIFAVLFYAGGQIIENSLEPGNTPVSPEDVFTALFAIFFAAQQAGQATALAPDMGKAQAAVDRIFSLLDFPSRINAIAMNEDNSKKKISSPEQIQGVIEFKNVWFRYPTRKEDFVLKGLNIKITSNEKVALVGESGCGKSTFVNLLMRFYDVDAGEVLLDGVNVKDYNLHDLRKAVSLVMQEPIIFNYSILENVLYGKLDATNTQVQEASEISNCKEFITNEDFQEFDNQADSLIKAMTSHKSELIAVIGEEKFDEEMKTLQAIKIADEKKGVFQTVEGDIDTREDALKDKKLHHGFQTQCGIKGGKLSGGQKQRVAIARTIIRQPRVLMLDEATSALDEDNQKLVQEALDKAMVGRTTIIIAHRLSTIQNCSKVFVLQEGKVSEEGSFDELKEKGGYLTKIAQQKK